MTRAPLISVVIPHVRGTEILLDCLTSLEATTYEPREVVLVDNASSDGSVAAARERFPWVRVVRNERNLGYAGGCNVGLQHSRGEFVLFLNDDVLATDPDWLSKLVQPCLSDSRVAACQPKLRSFFKREVFDYAGAAGGLMDVLGFPFCRGRIFFTLETDRGQYDDICEVFWASGTAMLVRRTALEEVGAFDADFFAHMEEIDLSWRLHLAGYKVLAVPQAVLYHRAGSTLKTDSFSKIYLNHRNSQVMLLKNYPWRYLLWVVPLRALLELAALLYSLLQRDWARARAILLACGYVLLHWPTIVVKRRRISRIRKVDDRDLLRKLYRGSVVVDYFLRGKHTAAEVLG